MKPSPYLPAAPLTDKDAGIWLRVTYRLMLSGKARSLAISFRPGCDDVDARRMSAIELTRAAPLNYTRPKNYPAWPMVMTLMRANHRWCGAWDLTDGT